MDDFPPSVSGFRSPAPARDDASMSSDGLPPPENPNEILTVAPKERFRLGYFDVMCLVMNRMIGKSSRACLALSCGNEGVVIFFFVSVMKNEKEAEEERLKLTS